MNKLYIIVIFFFGLISSLDIQSQSLKLNNEKYWNYRERLNNDFMLGIGSEIGYSFPFMERYRGVESTEAVLYWDDATIGLGYYIAVLATEYKLLNNNNKSTKSTIRELFYALEALNTLDYRAENMYYKPNGIKGNPRLNGFFIRDIATDSMNKSANYKLYNTDTNLLKVHNLHGGSMNITKTIFSEEMSKDQIIFIMVGLRLIKELIPENLEFKENNIARKFSNTNNTYIRKEAINIANRQLKYITKNKKAAFPLVYYHWNIINPVSNKTVDRGGDAFSQSYGFEKLYMAFNNKDSTLFTKKGERFAAKLVNGGTKTLLNSIIKSGEGHMVLTLAAISNQWNNKTKKKLEKKCFKDFKNKANYDFLVLLYAVLYNDSLDNNYKSYFKELLNSAPYNGPYNYNGNGDFANFEWSTSRRYSRPENRGTNRQSHPGDYNGLDYMLIHNLYNIYYNIKDTYENNISLRTKHLTETYSIFKQHYYNITSYSPGVFNKSYKENCKIKDTLFINGNRINLLSNNTKLPNNNSTFTLKLRKPILDNKNPSLISIDSTGILILGYKTENKTLNGVITIDSGACLIINKKANLELNANSNIIIKNKGQLVFEANSTIELNDSSCINIEEGGHLSIDRNAKLYFNSISTNITYHKLSAYNNIYPYISTVKEINPKKVKIKGEGKILFK
jgi:hypothetical protein